MGLCSVSTGSSRWGKRKRGRGDGKEEEEMKIENAAFSELKGAQGWGTGEGVSKKELEDETGEVIKE